MRFIKILVSTLVGYIALIVVYPYMIAFSDGSVYVVGTSLYESEPYRWLSSTGDELIYLDGDASHEVEIGMVNIDGDESKALLYKKRDESFHVVTNKKKSRHVFLTWKDPLGDESGVGTRFNVCDIEWGGGCEKKTIELVMKGTIYVVADYEDGVIYGRSLLASSVSGISGTLFLVSENDKGDPKIPEYLGGDVNPIAGVFWNDGIIYQEKGNVVYENQLGAQHVIAEVDSDVEMMFYGNDNSVLWNSFWWPKNSNENHAIYLYYKNNDSVEFTGMCPKMTENGVLYIDKGKGIYFLSSSNEKVFIREASMAYCSAHVGNKIFWAERRYNLAYPLHFISSLIGLTEKSPNMFQSYIFSAHIENDIEF